MPFEKVKLVCLEPECIISPTIEYKYLLLLFKTKTKINKISKLKIYQYLLLFNILNLIIKLFYCDVERKYV